jgi:hypothetical protein
MQRVVVRVFVDGNLVRETGMIGQGSLAAGDDPDRVVMCGPLN